MPNFLPCAGARVPVFPLLLLFFVYLLYLCVFESKLHSFYLIFFILFHILRVIRLDLELIGNNKLIQSLKFDFFCFFIGIRHGPEPMKLDHFLRVIFFVFYHVSFFNYFFNNTWIELTVSRKYGFAVCSFFKQRAVRLFQYFQKIGCKFNDFVGSISFYFCCLLFHIHLLY